MKFLNKNAYIQIALKGTNFCTSARKAWGTKRLNGIRVLIIQGLDRDIYRNIYTHTQGKVSLKLRLHGSYPRLENKKSPLENGK